MSRYEDCLAIFEIGRTGMRVTVTSKLTGKVASFDLLGEAQGIARFEFPDMKTLISEDAPPEPTPSMASPEKQADDWRPQATPKKRGRPPKNAAQRVEEPAREESGPGEEAVPMAAVVDEGTDWRPQEA